MKTYTLRPGNIAACFEVNDITCIYMADHKAPEAYKGSNMSTNIWATLPPDVRDHVAVYFRQIFALPVEKRAAFIDAYEPKSTVIEVSP